MQVTPVGYNAQEAGAEKKSVTEKDTFLQLLVTQMKYQDPLNPMSNTEFSAQLAEFSQLEELANMNKSLTESIETNLIISQSINNSMATTLIGKKVKTSGSEFSFKSENGSKELSFNLESAAAKVSIDVYDENGNLVYTVDRTNVAQGDSSFFWDGYMSDGSYAGDGTYSLEVTALDSEENAVKSTVFNVYRITGVKYSDGSANLMTDENILVKLGDVLEILQN
ncbi:MAG: flagellar hook capping protein [Candidatus Delongbacteria bacterium]|nr:flagellar hook capping protein [Candidatus Delongbacteria bacterium]MBN2833723.1 flagellar hook capping protein [Candidatus Delongbacteria bacterium]